MAELADSTNLEPPWLGQGLPVYPELDQLCRVAGPSLVGVSPAVYPGFVQQWVAPLAIRDREACYITEPNGISLGAGVVDCRLVGSYAGLPLYATACCPTAPFSSSSSVGH